MNTLLRTLSQQEILAVHGAHGGGIKLGFWPAAILLGFEILHAPVVLKENVDMVGRLWNSGCNNLDEEEYFFRGLCGIKNMITSPFTQSAKEEL